MNHETSKRLFNYWNTIRGERIAPRRFDVEPGRLGNILPDTFILERNASGAFVYRLAGTRLCEGMGTDLKGRDFLEAVNAADRATLEPQLGAVVAKGAVLLQVLEIETSCGGLGLVEVLLLPLTHSREAIERFLGCIVWLDAPPPLREHSIVAKRLKSHKLIWPAGGPIDPPEKPAYRPVEAGHQAPFPAHIRHSRIVRQERRQFRVYDGGLSKSPLDKH